MNEYNQEAIRRDWEQAQIDKAKDKDGKVKIGTTIVNEAKRVRVVKEHTYSKPFVDRY